MKIQDIFKPKSKETPIAASFEITGQPTAPAKPMPKRMKRVGKPKAKALPAGFKPVGKPVAKALPAGFKPVGKPVAKALPAGFKPVGKPAAPSPAKRFFSKPGVKKAGKVALVAAAPLAAGAFLAVKNRKAIAQGAGKVFKKVGKIGRRR